MSYIAFIGQIRNNEKLTFVETFNRAIIKTFGEENQYNDDYMEAVREGKFRQHLAWRKIINPVKWIEFLGTLTADLIDRVSQVGAPSPTGLLYNHPSIRGFPSDIDEIRPAYGFFRSFIRGIFKIIIGLPVAILKHFTSPINQIFRPLLHYAQKNPGTFWGLIFLTTLLVTAFVALAVLSGGTLPAALGFLAIIPGFTKGLAAIATAATFISLHIPLVSATAATIITQALFIGGSFITGLRLMHHLVANIASTIRDIYHLGRATKLEKQTKGAFSLGIVNSTHENVISRLLFNTPKTQEPIPPRDQGCGYGFRSFIGGYSYSPIPPREHTYSGLMLHTLDRNEIGLEDEKRRTSLALAKDAQQVVGQKKHRITHSML